MSISHGGSLNNARLLAMQCSYTGKSILEDVKGVRNQKSKILGTLQQLSIGSGGEGDQIFGSGRGLYKGT